eukprot:4784087-Alexandrium_andersonii.AAC.1
MRACDKGAHVQGRRGDSRRSRVTTLRHLFGAMCPWKARVARKELEAVHAATPRGLKGDPDRVWVGRAPRVPQHRGASNQMVTDRLLRGRSRDAA